jgi:integrase
MIHVTVYQALMTMEGLTKGRSKARETAPVAPVPDDHIRKVKADVGDEVSTIIDLQLHTAARSGELLSLKARDIDMSGAICIATVQEHKMAHHGKGRELYIGPKAQEILRPYLADTPIHERLFEYTLARYRRAITRACERCDVPRWTPHRLRHNAATAIPKRFGVEAAQVMLGHSGIGITQLYAEKDREHGLSIAGEIG